MPRKGKKGKGRRTKKHRPPAEDKEEEKEKGPRSLVFSRGSVSPIVAQLCLDWRESFLPNTSRKLKVDRKETLRKYARNCRLFGATHFQIMTCSTTGTYLRIGRLPHGPTLQFRVESFETVYDVKKVQRKPHTDQFAFNTPALPILNNFATSTKPHIKMAQTMLTNLFPQLRVDKVRLTDCRRVMLFNLNEDTDMIDVRHFLIVGHRQTANKAVKRLEKGKLPQDTGGLHDISELVANPSAYFSDSDFEGAAVDLSMPFRRLGADTKALLKLHEIGPRLTLSIYKIMAGFMDGEVIYHSFIKRTPLEIEELKRLRKKRAAERKARRNTQELKVEEKKLRKDEKKRRREERVAKGEGAGSDGDVSEASDEAQPHAKWQSDEEVSDGGLERDVGSPDEDAPAVKVKRPRVERIKDGKVKGPSEPRIVDLGSMFPDAPSGDFPRGRLDAPTPAPTPQKAGKKPGKKGKVGDGRLKEILKRRKQHKKGPAQGF